MKRFACSALTLLIITACSSSNLPETTISIGEQSFTCEVVSTPEQRQQGLMNRTELPENHGMLFKFEKPDFHTFWMKETPLALDIIWIDELNRVSEFTTAQPCNTDICQTYRPKHIAKYVIEVSAGTFAGQIGNKFRFGN